MTESKETNESIVLCYVNIGIPVTLAYDGDPPPMKTLRRHAIENFVDHPAIRDGLIALLDNTYVNSIDCVLVDIDGKTIREITE